MAAVLAGALLTILAHGTAVAAALWTLTPNVFTATTGVTTSYTLTATNLDAMRKMGCVRIGLTSAFTVKSVAVDAVSNGGEWLASASGSTATVRARDGGDRLDRYSVIEPAAWVQFTIVSTGNTPGIHTWSATAWEQQDCSGAAFVDVLPVTVTVSGSVTTPTPIPTPTSTASPSLLPPLPTRSPLGPIIDDITDPLPVDPTPAAQPAPTASSLADQDARMQTPAPGAPAAASGPGAGGRATQSGGQPGSGQVPAMGAPALRLGAPDDVTMSTSYVAVSSDPLVASIPAIVLGVPGLLIMILVGIQLVGAGAWIPAARRFRRGERVLGPGLVNGPGSAPSSEARLDRWTRMAWR